MFSTTSTARRNLARVVVAGAIAAVPLTALTVPASADPSPGVTEVRHNRHWNDRDCDFGPFQDWSCDNGPFSGWGKNIPFGQFRRLVPPGTFGSS
ncbi:hypothetical protein [Nocardia pneumoniae]|uniref:hypothetical protein n=1 Tax=Nocardia pneumoniae TaxID=228601 RepID=UPI0002DF05A3|nr:hypothetical protein [Nocardia pneumoniae]